MSFLGAAPFTCDEEYLRHPYKTTSSFLGVAPFACDASVTAGKRRKECMLRIRPARSAISIVALLAAVHTARFD
jgi:hypothetical protein